MSIGDPNLASDSGEWSSICFQSDKAVSIQTSNVPGPSCKGRVSAGRETQGKARATVLRLLYSIISSQCNTTAAVES